MPQAPVAELRRLDDVEILAQVGSSWILAKDVRPAVAEVMEERKGSVPPREWPVLERMATVRILDQLVETRLLYLAAKQRIPAERMGEIEKRLTAAFEEEELPRRVKEGKFGSVDAYRAKLEEWGGSLDQERRLYIERAIASQWLHHAIGPIAEPDPAELLAYYQTHIHEFETPAQVRWEEVWVNVPRYSEGQEARERLALVGNMLLAGMPLEAALANQPPDPPRCEGARRDWMAKGSMLVDPILEEVLFHLPIGMWSEIFRVGNRFYIVRVLERQEAVRTPFSDAQPEIRKRIVDERRREKIRNYLAELRSQVTIWTVFDDDPQVAAWRRMWAQSRR
ncbi:MAG: peptidylprolyl isomerase [Thermoguttaceae bacterium]|nr:peptidylprolyl isomerase [Thermoguttaceae bacterium]MDW8079111.1 peptidylprolyl isomerase [Thermoguttaceae bacterium]